MKMAGKELKQTTKKWRYVLHGSAKFKDREIPVHFHNLPLKRPAVAVTTLWTMTMWRKSFLMKKEGW